MTREEEQPTFYIKQEPYGTAILRYGQVILERGLEGQLRFGPNATVQSSEYEDFLVAFAELQDRTKNYSKEYLRHLIQIENNRIEKAQNDIEKYRTNLARLEEPKL